MSFNIFLSLSIAAAALVIQPSLAAADQGSAVIVNSGSTNTPGYKIVVERDGTAVYTPTPRGSSQSGSQQQVELMKRKLPPAVVQHLYSDLDAARPFSDLPRPRCVKSVSFGTRLTIEFKGDETPDLNCPTGQNAKLEALTQDAKQIVAAFDEIR